jgi:hypothetical protein
MAKNSKTILITTTSGTSPFAAVKGIEIQAEGSQLEKASPNSGKWREYLAGRCGWSFTANYLATRLADLLKVNESYNIKVYDSADNTNYITGTAILRICRIDAAETNLVTGSFQFIGSGPLSLPATT